MPSLSVADFQTVGWTAVPFVPPTRMSPSLGDDEHGVRPGLGQLEGLVRHEVPELGGRHVLLADEDGVGRLPVGVVAADDIGRAAEDRDPGRAACGRQLGGPSCHGPNVPE